MSTTGADFRFNNDRPPPTNSKRSFLQRLNKRHGKLSLHMRSKRGERHVPRQTEQSHHSPSQSTSTIETSEPSELSSLVSVEPLEHNYTETASRYYDVDDEISPTNLNFSPHSQLEGEFEVPMRYAIAQNDTDGGHDFIQGMHEFIVRKHASNALKPMDPGLSLHSRQSSSGGASSHMSEEQVDDWLDHPEDAKLHRARTYSSSNVSVMVHPPQTSNEIKMDVTENEIENASLVPRHSRQISNPYSKGPSTESDTERSRTRNTTVKEIKVLASAQKKVAFKFVVVEENQARGLFSLPDELLQTIANHLDANSTWLFRLSCKKLYNVVSKPDPPSGSEEDLQIFFSSIRSFFPANLIYCGQCRKYHPWMWGDDYYNDDRPGIQAHQCRRHLESGRRPRDEILGTGNYLCDSCNTLRPDKKCKTCGKCVLCAKLRQSWMLISWIEDECELCAASHSPKWKHWKGEFEGRHNPGAHREWMGV